MKRIIIILFTFFVVLSMSACSGNFAQVDLKKPITIPENGVIEKDVLDKVKKDNAIATFVGNSNGIEYKWIVFGKDIKETRDVNLTVEVQTTEKGVILCFSEIEEYGFTALLSVYLNEKWSADSASAFSGKVEYGSVSITGSKTSILNVSINKAVEQCEIIPDTKEKDESNNSQSSIDTPSTEDTTEPINTTPAPDNTSTDSENTLLSPDDIITDSNDTPPFPDGTPSKEEDTSIQDESDTNKRPISDGKETGQDDYKTDPVPEGKPLPVEPEDQEIDKRKKYACTFSIECSTILNNLSSLDPDKLELVPSSGVILAPTKVTFYEGESVFDVLKRVCKENNIHLEFSWTPIYNSAYIEGIHNLYEFDCGELSGWMYRVDGWYPNYGCSRYQLADGEVVEWRYTCDLGRDVGEDRLGQS